MERIKIILSDPQVLFREGVHFTISGMEDFEVASEATNNEDAFAFIEAEPPGIAILNMSNGKFDGPAITRRIKRILPSVLVILFMDSESEERVFAGMKSGACACLSKDIDPEHLVNIIMEVTAGTRPVIEQLLTPGLASRVLAEFEGLTALDKRLNNLLALPSPGEIEVLKGIAAGHGIEQAAARIDGDEHAVRRQLGVIVDKLVANDRSLGLIKALERSLPAMISSLVTAGEPGKGYLTREEFTSFKESLMQPLKPLIGKTV